MITLSNGAQIYNFGKPNLFIMSGVHGEERSGPMALFNLLKRKKNRLDNIWILPVLNVKGYEELNRLCGGINIQDQFFAESKLDFVNQLVSIIGNNVPFMFVDLHEDCESEVNYIWSHWDNYTNNPMIEMKVQQYCIKNNYGLTYAPDTPKMSVGTTETYMRAIGAHSSYTAEVKMYESINKRVEDQESFIEFFIETAKAYE